MSRFGDWLRRIMFGPGAELDNSRLFDTEDGPRAVPRDVSFTRDHEPIELPTPTDQEIAFARRVGEARRSLQRLANPNDRIAVNNQMLAQQMVDTYDQQVANGVRPAMPQYDGSPVVPAGRRVVLDFNAAGAPIQRINGVDVPLNGTVTLVDADGLLAAREARAESERMMTSYEQRGLGGRRSRVNPEDRRMMASYAQRNLGSRTPRFSRTELMPAVTPAQCAVLKPAEIQAANRRIDSINRLLARKYPGVLTVPVVFPASLKPHVRDVIITHFQHAGWIVAAGSKQGRYNFTGPAPTAEQITAALEPGVATAAATPDEAARTRVVDLSEHPVVEPNR